MFSRRNNSRLFIVSLHLWKVLKYIEKDKNKIHKFYEWLFPNSMRKKEFYCLIFAYFHSLKFTPWMSLLTYLKFKAHAMNNMGQTIFWKNISLEKYLANVISLLYRKLGLTSKKNILMPPWINDERAWIKYLA